MDGIFLCYGLLENIPPRAMAIFIPEISAAFDSI